MTGTSNARIPAMGISILDEVFVMGDGFICNFSNRTIADIFGEELQHEKASLTQLTGLS